MAINPDKFRVTDADEITTERWNEAFAEVVLAIAALQAGATTIEEARNELIRLGLFRINEALAPAFELVQEYQTAGFLNAAIAENSEVSFAVGSRIMAIDPDKKALFRPSPVVVLTRSSNTTDLAVATTSSYDPEAGALVVNVLTLTGSAGPHQDVVVWATAGSALAQNQYLVETKAARDRAKDWAEKADGQNVDGSGTRSAKHWAGQAATSAGTATTQAGVATTKAGEAATSKSGADSAKAGAEAARDAALGFAADAEASAEAAALFDPSNYYPKASTYSKTEVDSGFAPKTNAALTGTPTAPTAAGGTNTTQIATTAFVAAAIAALIDGAPGAIDTLNELAAALGDDPNFATTVTNLIATKANSSHTHAQSDITGLVAALAALQPADGDLTALAALASTGFAVRSAANTWLQRVIAAGTGLTITNGDGVSGNPTPAIDKASDANVRSAASNKVVTSDLIETACAIVGLTDGTNIALDWDAGINFDVTLAGARTLSNPTNVQVGTTRTVMAKASSGTRSLAFGTNYKSPPTIADITSSKWYLITLFAYSATHIAITAMEQVP